MSARTSASPQVIGALARFDGRKLATSGWVLVGLGIAALGTAAFVSVVFTDASATWEDDVWTAHVGFMLLAVFTMVAVNWAALRDHREHTTEQYESLPADKATRIVAMLGAAALLALGSTLLLGAVAWFASTQLDVPALTIVHVLHNGALVLMLSSLGLALAAWIPNPFLAPVAAFAFYLIHPGESVATWHAIWPMATLLSAGLAIWHIAYLVGLTLMLAALAQARWRARASQAIALLAGSAIVAVALTVIISRVCPTAGSCLL